MVGRQPNSKSNSLVQLTGGARKLAPSPGHGGKIGMGAMPAAKYPHPGLCEVCRNTLFDSLRVLVRYSKPV